MMKNDDVGGGFMMVMRTYNLYIVVIGDRRLIVV